MSEVKLKTEENSEDTANASSQAVNKSTYEKAATYWSGVEPTISGMLGGVNVGFLGIINYFEAMFTFSSL